MTAKEVADRLDVTVQSVYRWAKSGDLDSLRVGGVVRFRRRSIERLLAGKGDDAA